MIKLYSAEGSNSSERIEWVLVYKQIAFERVEVSAASLKSDYLAINPFGYVPALAIDGQVLSESMAIAEYLEERFPEPPLLGKDAITRAQIRRVCEHVNATIHTPQNRTVLAFFRPELTETSKKHLRGEWISHCLKELQAQLCQHSVFAVGDAFSLADIFVACMYRKGLQHGASAINFYEHYLAVLAEQEHQCWSAK